MITPVRHTELLPGTLQNLYFPPLDYTYFARAANWPFSGSNVITRAAWAADAAMLAYARRGKKRMSDEDLDAAFKTAGLHYQKLGGTLADWNAPGTQAIFAWCDKFAIMAFRGTEADDPEDCLYDADITLVYEHDYRPVAHDPGPALGFLAHVAHLCSPPCFVHRGFQRALNNVWDQVHDLVSSYRRDRPGAEICFTGHSLGGALAVLSFSRFADPDISLFTFGCPRVGDGAFRERVLGNPGRGIHRFVNFNDAVAHIPLESLFYHHSPPSCYRVDENGGIAPDDGNFKGDVLALRAALGGLPASIHLDDLDRVPAPPSVVDHSPARYCYRLWDCV